MVKKKKSGGPKRDARGYGQPQSASSSTRSAAASAATAASSARAPKVSTLKVTSATQNHLDQVLMSLERPSASSSLASPALEPPLPNTTTTSSRSSNNPQQQQGPSDRFAKRLSNINDRLVDASFRPEHVDQVVVALGYEITLESALDWLCANLPAHEVPPLFTNAGEGSSPSATMTTSSNLQVIVPMPQSLTSSSAVEGGSTASIRLPRSDWAESTAKDDASPSNGGASEHKSWILQQYQYCNDDEGDNDSEAHDRADPGESDSATSDHHQQHDSPAHESDSDPMAATAAEEENGDDVDPQPVSEEGHEPDPSEASASASLPLASPEENALESLRHKLSEARADAADDASNYLRSKHEIKQLRRHVEQLTRRVADAERALRARRERLQAGELAAAAQAGNPLDGDDDGEGEGGLFDMFNEEVGGQTPTSAETASQATPQNLTDASPEDRPPTIEFPPDALKSWTGKTPRQLLQEHCQKHRWSKPKYLIERDRCSLAVTPPGDHQVWQTELLGTYTSTYEALMANEYVATKMLYRMQSDRPLYRILPPYFSDLWKGWRDAERRTEVLAKAEVTDERSRRIQQLIDLIEATANDRLANNSTADPSIREDVVAERKAYPIPEARRVPAEAIDDRKLQKIFLDRCTTPQYQKMLRARSSLPIFPFRDRILECVRAHPVTVLSAETGAGKSTNCGQFILEEALQAGHYASILCTQPRRVAATSVAERVADEMGEASVGKLVGYQIRLESRKCADTRLLFCTTGVVLRRLADDPTLCGVTHVIVDEVHERQWQIDVLLVSLRRLLYGSRPDLKVVLMSATLDSKLFCSYFGGAPLVSVPGRTFPVSSYYLEDLLEETGHVIEEDSMFARRDRNSNQSDAVIWVSSRGGEKKKETHSLQTERDLTGDFEGYSVVTQRSMDRVDESIINYDLIEDLLRTIILKPKRGWKVLQFPPEESVSSGAVLIFLPGFGEIKTLVERLQGSRDFGRRDVFDIIPMHSSLSSTDQRRAFRTTPQGSLVRKIVVATNIAETSVTIPEVTVVIDSGRVREMHHDKRTSTPKLKIAWCSKSSTKQRAGRAGRTQAGMCLKLFSSKTEHCLMKDINEPELMRIPLEEVCLNILATGLTRSCKVFLRDAPQAPPEASITLALDRLQEIGAISVHETFETMTPLGRLLAQLPLDARLGKMLIYGALFKCVDPISTIAACLSATKSVIATSFAGPAQGSSRLSRFSHPTSDFLTLVNVYESFLKAEASGTGRRFCQDNFLNFSALQEASKAKELYIDLLRSIGLLDSDELGINGSGSRLDRGRLRDCSQNINFANEDLLHAVIFGGVYPNVARVATINGGHRRSGPARLEQKNEQMEVHASSANHTLPVPLPSHWLAFGEKLGTGGKRITVSTTCFVSEMALLLLANDMAVKHFERRVIVDGWMDVVVPARTAVTIKAVRLQLDRLLTSYFESQVGRSSPAAIATSNILDSTVNSIVKLFSESNFDVGR